MKTKELLTEMNICFNESTDNIFEYIIENNDSIVLDLFPRNIKDSKKYQSVEVFYQKVLDHNMKKRKFEEIENRFMNFIKTLWLYNETYVNVLSSEIFENFYYKKNKKLLKKYSSIFSESINEEEFLLIEDKDVLYSFCVLAIRDISPVVFYFKNSKILIMLSGCTGLVYYGSSKDILFTKQLACNCSLYLYSKDINI